MHDLLLEVLSEEIPSRMQKYAKDRLYDAFLKEVVLFFGINKENLDVFVGPRRIAVLVSGIPDAKVFQSKEKKGPSKEASQDVIEKFLNSCKESRSSLYTKTVNGKEYYFLKTKNHAIPAKDALISFVKNLLNNFSWPNPMRWGEHEIKWIRPITSILCLFDNQVLPFDFFRYKSCQYTHANRTLACNSKIQIQTACKYKDTLYDNFVVVDQDQRKSLIKKQIDLIKNREGVEVCVSDDLLEEVIGLVEWPHCIVGKFDKKFLDLPEKLIINVIEKHQKIFSVFLQGKITNSFVVVANFNNDSVVYGYQKVVNSRLADALSMIEQDTKHALQFYVQKLDKIMFHQRLGSFFDKVKRITSLAKFIAVWVPNASITKVEGVAQICKADLATSVVKEFPEMAGFVGYHYLKIAGEEDQDILSGVMSHNMPVNAHDQCPTNPIAIAVSLADKLDSLVGFFSVAEKVTSVKDPLGMRRNAVSILRTILENKIELSINVVVMKAADLYPSSVFCGIMDKIVSKPEEEKLRKSEAIDRVLDFVRQRFFGLLKAKGVSSAVFDFFAQDLEHPLEVQKRCTVITAFLKSQSGLNFLKPLKRIYNILRKCNALNAKGPKYSKKMLVQKEEVALATTFDDILPKLEDFLKGNDFDSALDLLAILESPLNNFMDNVVINCEDVVVKENRLALLSFIYCALNKVFDFGIYFDC